jgi:hypothetical protein
VVRTSKARATRARAGTVRFQLGGHVAR